MLVTVRGAGLHRGPPGVGPIRRVDLHSVPTFVLRSGRCPEAMRCRELGDLERPSKGVFEIAAVSVGQPRRCLSGVVSVCRQQWGERIRGLFETLVPGTALADQQNKALQRGQQWG